MSNNNNLTRFSELSKAIVQCYTNHSVEDNLRSAYENLWIEQKKNHTDEPNWWQQRIVDTGDEIVELFAEHFPLRNKNCFEKNNTDEADDLWVKSNEVEIAYQHTSYRFQVSDSNTLIIGRRSECDVQILDAAVSRVAALLYLLPQWNQLLVVDVGAFYGIKITDRDNNNNKQNERRSKMFNRRVFSLEWHESGVIEISPSISFTIMPKQCVICYENPRSICFQPCMHFVTCLRCSRRFRHCPICKQYILYKDQKSASVHSHIKIQ